MTGQEKLLLPGTCCPWDNLALYSQDNQKNHMGVDFEMYLFMGQVNYMYFGSIGQIANFLS